MPRQLQLSLNYTQQASNVPVPAPPPHSFCGFLTKKQRNSSEPVRDPTQAPWWQVCSELPGARHSSSNCHQEGFAQLRKNNRTESSIPTEALELGNKAMEIICSANQWFTESSSSLHMKQEKFGQVTPGYVTQGSIISSLRKNQYPLVTVRPYI